MGSERTTTIGRFTIIYRSVPNAEGTHTVVYDGRSITVHPDGQHSTRKRYEAICRALERASNTMEAEAWLLRGGLTVVSSSTTQRDRILWLLRDRRAVCANDMLEMRMPRYAARILELRKAGFAIVTRKCSQHDFHRSRVVEYKLVFDPDRNSVENMLHQDEREDR